MPDRDLAPEPGVGMDVMTSPRELRRRRLRRYGVALSIVLVVLAIGFGAMRLGSSVPTFEREAIWVDTVRRGAMVREIQGVGSLVPKDDAVIWLAAERDGRVDRRLVDEGASVEPDTVILRLSNPDLEQAAVAAELAFEAAQAAYKSLEAVLNGQLLQQRSVYTAIEAEHRQAAMQAEVDTSLAKDGLLADLTARQSSVKEEALETRRQMEKERLATVEQSLAAQLDAQRAEVESRRTTLELRRRDVANLTVRAGMAGVLQEIAVVSGERVARGTRLARVADPTRLQAEIRIPEAQTQDVHNGLPVVVDTYNGLVEGTVSRVAPAAQNGTVTVDVELRGALPAGARPDMTVDGVIQLEKLDDVLYVGRPTGSREGAELPVYRLSADETLAERTLVRIGRTSATEVEIVSGLDAGDRVVLSEVASWQPHEVVRLR